MNIKSFFSDITKKGVFHIFAGSFLTKFVSFFASIVVVRILSKTDYGILSYYENLYSYFYLLAGYGLGNAVLRYVIISDSLSEKKSILSYCKWNGTKFNIFLVLIGMGFSFIYKHPAEFNDYRFFLIIILLFLPFQYITNLYIFNERAFYDNKNYALISFLYSSILIGFKVVGASIWQLFGALIAPLFIHVCFSICLDIFDKRRYFQNTVEQPIDNDKKKEINKYAIQYMITNGLWALFSLNSTFILGRTIGDAELLADYKIATILPGVISIVSTSIGIFIAPYFTKREASKDYNWVRSNWKKMMIFSLILMGFIVAFLFFIAPIAIKLVFGEKYSSSFPIMRLLLIAAFFDAGIRYPTANLLAAMNKIKYNMFVSFIGIVMQIILAILLSYKYSIIGIAISNILVQFIMSLLVNIFFLVCFFNKRNNLEKTK